MPYKLEIKKKLLSKEFRWIEFNLWKFKKEYPLYVQKIHAKFPLTLHTWKICLQGFPGSLYVNWKNV
jgi:hypothetical protein